MASTRAETRSEPSMAPRRRVAVSQALTPSPVDAVALSARAQDAAIRAEAIRSETRLRRERGDALIGRFKNRQRHQALATRSRVPSRSNRAAKPQSGKIRPDGRGRSVARQEPAGTVALLCACPELAADLPVQQRPAAQRSLTVPAIKVHTGQWDPAACEDDPRLAGPLFGLLVIEGLLVRELISGRRCSTQSYGPGDLLDPHGGARRSSEGPPAMWCPATATVALLDDGVLSAMRRWPRLIGGLFAQTMRQAGRVDAGSPPDGLRFVSA
jgi:hypothetical protein